MNKIKTISAFILALPLLTFGANYFLHFFPLPPQPDSSGVQLLNAMRQGGLMGPVALSHVIIAIMLLLPKTRFLGALLQMPMSIGILAFHITMEPAGTVIALIIILLNIGVLADIPKLKLLMTKEK